MTRPYQRFRLGPGQVLDYIVVVGGPYWAPRTPQKTKFSFYEIFYRKCGHVVTTKYTPIYDLLRRRADKADALRTGYCPACAKAITPTKPVRPVAPTPATPEQYHWALRVWARRESAPCPRG